MATEFGTVKPLGENYSSSTIPYEIPAGNDIRAMRLLLSPIQSQGIHWTIVIRDALERPLAALSSEQFSRGNPFWTDRFTSNYLQVFVSSNARVGEPVIRAVEYVAIPREAQHPYYSLQGLTPAWRSLYEPRNAENPTGGGTTFFRRIGDSVGMLIAHAGNHVTGYKSWTCSGFLVANKPNLLFVTNDHCGGPWNANSRWSEPVCSSAIVDFSWNGAAVPREYKCRRVYRDRVHDLAVLKLAGSTEVPPEPLRLRGKEIGEEEIAILHHPAALEKQISDHCHAVTAFALATTTVNGKQDFAYPCDTEGGSSGAPVLDKGGRVVGIHHIGFQTDAHGRCDQLNKAIKTNFLVEFLRSKHLRGFIVN